jgi:putative endonuclease
MKYMKNREKGTLYEEKALEFLKGRGYQLLTRNFYSKYGEIDLIVKKDCFIVFVEVKYRKNDFFGSGMEAVNKKKQRRIYLTAMKYIQNNNLEDADFRFDLISFSGEKLTWNRDIIWGDDIGL